MGRAAIQESSKVPNKDQLVPAHTHESEGAWMRACLEKALPAALERETGEDLELRLGDPFASVLFNPRQLHCEQSLLREAIVESGLDEEFSSLELEAMMRLAADANALMSAAVCVGSDNEFESMLQSFEPPHVIEEVGFLFGYMEHLRQTLMNAMAPAVDARFRQDIRRRCERAHHLCRQAVLNA